MEIPILSGIYTPPAPEIRSAYPVNLVPIAVDSGLSSSYLRPAEGLRKISDGIGVDRGGIWWTGGHYRVVGGNFVKVGRNGEIEILAEIGDDQGGHVTMDYGFDHLVIASDKKLFYWDGETMTRGMTADITDDSSGKEVVVSKGKEIDDAIDFLWVDGYYLYTDGEHLVTSNLNDPTKFSLYDYGSSEGDPDNIVAVKRLRSEVYAVNRYSIEVFQNKGSATEVGGFPFERVKGAQIRKGAVGTHACCTYRDSVAFVGGGRNEPLGVYAGLNGQIDKLSTREIDRILKAVPPEIAVKIKMEVRIESASTYLHIHLPDKTLVYDFDTTKTLGTPIWFVLSSGSDGVSKYRARNFTFAYGQWWAGDPDGEALGVFDAKAGDHWGKPVHWEFSTPIIFPGVAGVVHSLELSMIGGRQTPDDHWRISSRFSNDGISWSQPRSARPGRLGGRERRIIWRRMGLFRHWRIQKFYGDSRLNTGFARLDAEIGAANG